MDAGIVVGAGGGPGAYEDDGEPSATTMMNDHTRTVSRDETVAVAVYVPGVVGPVSDTTSGAMPEASVTVRYGVDSAGGRPDTSTTASGTGSPAASVREIAICDVDPEITVPVNDAAAGGAEIVIGTVAVIDGAVATATVMFETPLGASAVVVAV